MDRQTDPWWGRSSVRAGHSAPALRAAGAELPQPGRQRGARSRGPPLAQEQGQKPHPWGFAAQPDRAQSRLGLQLGPQCPPCVGARWHLPWAQPPRLSGLKCLYSVYHHYRFLNWGGGGVLLQSAFVAMGPELAQEERRSCKQKWQCLGPHVREALSEDCRRGTQGLHL